MTERRLETGSGTARRLLAAALGFVIALLGLTSVVGPAAARYVVGPQPVLSILTVGPHGTTGQENVGVRGPPLRQIVSATGVAAETDSGIGVDRGDGRDSQGKFVEAGGYGVDAQAQGLADYTEVTGRDVIDDQVRVSLPDGSVRYYDGLSRNADGTYQGVEVKSGSARLTPGQRAFDAQVNGGTPATATLRGVSILVTSTYNVSVP